MNTPVEWCRYTSLVAIDPGNCTGWAVMQLFDGTWRLTGAGVEDGRTHWDAPLSKFDVLVIETPERAFDGIPIGGILKLREMVGRYVERFGPRAKLIEKPEPRDWKGTVHGDVMCRRIEAAMSVTETALISRVSDWKRHNALDAIGIAKWAVRQPFMRYKAA